jgi:hypothetical protein
MSESIVSFAYLKRPALSLLTCLMKRFSAFVLAFRLRRSSSCSLRTISLTRATESSQKGSSSGMETLALEGVVAVVFTVVVLPSDFKRLQLDDGVVGVFFAGTDRSKAGKGEIASLGDALTASWEPIAYCDGIGGTGGGASLCWAARLVKFVKEFLLFNELMDVFAAKRLGHDVSC